MKLGLIEGYYGTPWTWDARADVIARLAPHGYEFHIYAPKADAFLRRRWREDYPADVTGQLRCFAQHCRELGVRFGIGLSPFELYRNFDAAGRATLARKLAQLDEIGIDDLAILFDDMRGDLPDLARTQIEIVHVAAAHTKASRLIVCPSYYTDDPVLDHFYGERPQGYLEELGRSLDPAIEIFWTGPEVCSREFTTGHLARVAGHLRRKPFLWDNYPVNDGPRMSQFLHLRAFTGRPAAIGSRLEAHAINPALQPTLSLIPAMTLAESYRLGETYDYGLAFERAASEILGTTLAKCARDDLNSLQDAGLDRLEQSAAKLRARYAAFNHPAAREIVAWLDGAFRVTREMMGA